MIDQLVKIGKMDDFFLSLREVLSIFNVTIAMPRTSVAGFTKLVAKNSCSPFVKPSNTNSKMF